MTDRGSAFSAILNPLQSSLPSADQRRALQEFNFESPVFDECFQTSLKPVFDALANAGFQDCVISGRSVGLAAFGVVSRDHQIWATRSNILKPAVTLASFGGQTYRLALLPERVNSMMPVLQAGLGVDAIAVASDGQAVVSSLFKKMWEDRLIT